MMIKIEDAHAGYSIWDGFSNITFQKARILYFEPEENRQEYTKLDARGIEYKEIEKPSCVIALNGKEQETTTFPIIHDGWIAKCVKNDGDVFTIFFDTVGYLLNDSGKTIEVIR
jgi:hypothetical protein